MKALHKFLIKASICLSVFGCTFTTISCNNEIEATEASKSSKVIDITPITPSTRSALTDKKFTEGYHCTSKSSSLVSDIYLDDTNREALVNVLNDKDEIAFCLNVKLDNTESEDGISYVAYNEFNEPIMKGKYDPNTTLFSITEVYDNDIIPRVSVANWGCNLGLLGANLVWSVPVGMISMGASVAVSVAFSCAAIQICSGL
ncbi:MAG: hypothetical protein NC388_05235 [Clostridium sp.]|nr:hypothetical protein [Clostridium sp.]